MNPTIKTALKATLVLTLVLASAKMGATQTNVPPPYAALVSQLQAGTSVPIYLPGGTTGQPSPLYAVISSLSSGDYSVTTSTTRSNCASDACEYAAIYGDVKTSSTPTLSGSPVPLPNIGAGVIGYYNAFTCAIACGESTISWDLNGYRYMVGVHIGSLAEVSAIATQMVAVSSSSGATPLSKKRGHTST